MDSFDVELKTSVNSTSTDVSTKNEELSETSSGKPAKINAQASSNYISVVSRHKGLLGESHARTFTQLSSNLNTYLKDPQSIKDLEVDKDSAQMGNYRKLTVQVINRDPTLQEKVAQDLSSSHELIRSRDAATTLESNLKKLPESLSEGTSAGKNLSKFICQSVVNLTDYESMGAGLQRDLAIRDVYAPNTELSPRSKIATTEVLSASIAYVKSNQPEVLATLKEEQVVQKTKPGSTTPQIMTRYLRQALDEFPEESTYLDIFKQNKHKVDGAETTSEDYADPVSKDTAKRIHDLVQKAADTARRSNLIPGKTAIDQEIAQQTQSANSQNLDTTSKTDVDAKNLSLSELSARAAKLQQQFREDRIRLANEGKLPDPAQKGRTDSTVSTVSAEQIDALDKELSAKITSDKTTSAPVKEQAPATPVLTADEIKKLALEAVKEALKETVKTQIEASQNSAKEVATQVANELKETVKAQLEVTQNSAKQIATQSVKEALEQSVKAQLEVSQNSAKEVATQVANELKESVKAQLADTQNSAKQLATQSVKEALEQSAKAQLEVSQNSAKEVATQVANELKESVKAQLETTQNSTKDIASQSVKEALEKTVKEQLEATKQSATEAVKEAVKESVKAQIEAAKALEKEASTDTQAKTKSEFSATPIENAQVKYSYSTTASSIYGSISSLHQIPAFDSEFNKPSIAQTIASNSLSSQQTQEKVTAALEQSALNESQKAADTESSNSDSNNVDTDTVDTADETEISVVKDKQSDKQAVSEQINAENKQAQIKAQEQAAKVNEQVAVNTEQKQENKQVILDKNEIAQKEANTKAQEQAAKLTELTVTEDTSDVEDTQYETLEKDIKADKQVIADKKEVQAKELEANAQDKIALKDNNTEQVEDTQEDTEDLKENTQTISVANSQANEQSDEVKDNSEQTTKTVESVNPTFTVNDVDPFKDDEVVENNPSLINPFASKFNTASGIGVTTNPSSTENTSTVKPDPSVVTVEQKAAVFSQANIDNDASDDSPISNPDNEHFDKLFETADKSTAPTDNTIKPSVLTGLTSTSDTEPSVTTAQTSRTSGEKIATSILQETVPSDELEDSIVPSDVKGKEKDLSALTKGEAKDVDNEAEFNVSTIPSKTPGAAAITSGQSEPIPNHSVVDEVEDIKEKTGFFSKIASIFGKKEPSNEVKAQNTPTPLQTSEAVAASNFMALNAKDSPLDNLTYSLKVQINNQALPQVVRDQAKEFLDKLENPIDDLPSVSNWLNFTAGPMSPSSPQALALHQWAFLLLSIRFSQLGKSVDKFLKKNVDLMEDKFDAEIEKITKKMEAGSRGTISSLIDDTFEQVTRYQNPAKENLPLLYQFIPLPPSYDGGREGGFNARPVVEEDGKTSWHLNFVFDLQNLGPIEIKAVAKLPELKLSVVASTFDGLQKVQECLPFLRGQLQELGITTRTATARLGKVHLQDNTNTPVMSENTKKNYGSTLSVDI